MALAGKDLGKEVGQWFGPSTAAGAIKCVTVSFTTHNSLTNARQPRALVHAFPKAELGVSIAADSVIYQSDVYAASHNPTGSPKRHVRKSWGNRGVLVLIGIRLGIGGVNPVYYEAIKVWYWYRDPPLMVGTDPILRPLGDLHLAPVSWNCRWSSIFFVLLRRFPSGQPLLSGSPSRPTLCPFTTSAWGVGRRP